MLNRLLGLAIMCATSTLVVNLLPHAMQIPAVASYRSAASRDAAMVDCADGESTAANCDSLLAGR
jgi:hypothetical protein